VKYTFIKDKNVDEFTVARFCKVLDISRGGYYDWLKREPSKRQRSKVLLDGLIKTTHEKSLKYGGNIKAFLGHGLDNISGRNINITVQ